MTQDQLKSAVLALGFERDFYEEGLFMPSLTRALHTIYTDRPVTKTVSIAFYDPGAREICEGFVHTPGEAESFKIDGRAYAFRISGRGSYTLGEGDEAQTEDFDTDMALVRGHVAAPTTITFFGDYAYSVRALTSFEHLTGPEIEDIPQPGKWRTVDLGTRYSDYLATESAPRFADGGVPRGVEIVSGILRVPSELVGEVYITYRRKPTIPTLGEDDEIIDVPAEVEELLPLLVAAYLWLDDAPERAQYYMALYREGIAGINRFSARKLSAEYATNGWA